MDENDVRQAVRAVAGERATVRVEGQRIGVVIDASGLDAPARDALEAAVRMAAARPGHEVRTVVTAERAQRRLVAVASGKGGVGKSTLSANLAIALARAGRRTGLVDADIYGPSQPRLMAVEGTRPEARDKVLLPVATPYGVPLLSMGQLVEPGRAIAWRGPMTAGALGQLVDADWGLADTLVVDLPPGTGDVQLTMVQKHRPAGAVIVSTPQDLALIDARRAIDLFQKAGVPIIGLVENMAGYACPHCGEVSDPFGRGGAEAAAREAGIAFLGRVPLDLAIRVASDAGEPPAARDDDRVFAPIATQVAEWLGAH
ncbi:ATP-binding protein involved in chromosome partitioning [Sphingomonas sp. BK580]|nr:Mrp/NBP35 family ATP-binding protein [Sphingomonas sp. BK580]MBB3691561.1 ATP-binding protein involved in chromosome partitioning [Sphingomonas sp. BK580]